MSRRFANPATGRTRSRTAVRECSCGQPTRDGAYVCETCLDQMASDLRELLPTGGQPHVDDLGYEPRLGYGTAHVVPVTEPGLWDALQSVTAGERGIDYRALGGASGGSDETGLVLDETAARRARRLRDTLRRLVVACMANRVDHTAPAEWSPKSTTEVPAMAEWLSWRVTGMAFHPEFASAPRDLGRAVDNARSSVMPPPYRQWLGECGIEGCHGSMLASRDETFATCDVCDAWIEARVRRDWLIEWLEDQLCTAAEIADLYDPEPAERERIRKRLNQWVRRGDLVGWPRISTWRPGACAWPNPPNGRNTTPAERDGEPLVFRFADAFDLLTQHDAQHAQHAQHHTEIRRDA